MKTYVFTTIGLLHTVVVDVVVLVDVDVDVVVLVDVVLVVEVVDVEVVDVEVVVVKTNGSRVPEIKSKSEQHPLTPE